MKIQNEKFADQNIILPFVGKVKFDEKGVAEVEEAPDELFEAVEGLHPAGKKAPAPKKDENPKDEKSESQKMRETAVANINAAKKADLQAMAKEAELPEAEWSELNAGDLKEYMIKQLPVV